MIVCLDIAQNQHMHWDTERGYWSNYNPCDGICQYTRCDHAVWSRLVGMANYDGAELGRLLEKMFGQCEPK